MSDARPHHRRPLFEQASDPILIVDRDGMIQEANWRSARLLGYAQSELIGMDLRDLIPAADLLRQPLQLPALRQGKPERVRHLPQDALRALRVDGVEGVPERRAHPRRRP